MLLILFSSEGEAGVMVLKSLFHLVVRSFVHHLPAPVEEKSEAQMESLNDLKMLRFDMAPYIVIAANILAWLNRALDYGSASLTARFIECWLS